MVAFYGVYKGEVITLTSERLVKVDNSSLIKIGYSHILSDCDSGVMLDSVIKAAKKRKDYGLIKKLIEVLDCSADGAYSQKQIEVLNNVSKSLRNDFIILSMFLIFSFISFFYKPEAIPEAESAWFMRSGSILTVFPYIYELFISKHRIELEEAKNDQTYFGMPLYGSLYLSGKFYFWEVWVSRYRYSLMVLGTLIWGYGDLIHKAFWAWLA